MSVGVSHNYVYLFLGFRVWGPYSKDYSILGSILGSPCLGEPIC